MGDPCTLLRPPQPGTNRAETETGACQTTVCASYMGSSGYCTQSCSGQGQTCPSGFACCKFYETGTPQCGAQTCGAQRVCINNACVDQSYCVKASSC